MKDFIRWLILVRNEQRLRTMQPAAVHALAGAVATLHYVAQAGARRVIARNLARDTGLAGAPLRRAVFRSFVSHTLDDFDLPRYPVIDRAFVDRHMRFTGPGWDHVRATQGRATLLMTFHFGPNQIVIPALPLLGFSFTQIGVPPSYWNELVGGSPRFREVNERRTRNLEGTRARFIYVSAGMRSLRAIYRAAAAGELLCVAADGRFGELQAHPFLRGSLDINLGPFRIAREAGLAVVPTFSVRRPDGYGVEMDAPLDAGMLNIDDVVRTCVLGLEERVRRHPEQYGWMYHARAVGR